MQKRLAYKFRLNPNAAQARQLMGMCHATRFVWNWALAQSKAWYEAAHEIYSYEMDRANTEIKRIEKLSGEKLHKDVILDIKREYVDVDLKPTRLNIQGQLKLLKKQYPWLAEECEGSSLQRVLINLEKAYDKFFKACKRGERAGPPRFKKSKKKNDDGLLEADLSFTTGGTEYSSVKIATEGQKGEVKLPKIKDPVKFVAHRQIKGTVKETTISYNGLYWFISFSSLEEIEEPICKSKSAVGVDLGIVKSAVLSDGTVYPARRVQKENADRLKKLAQKFARSQKGSNRSTRTKRKLRKKYFKMRNQRNHHIHKITDDICKNHATIVIEDLGLAKMSESAKGTIKEPGKNVKIKSRLNRELLDASLYQYKRQLEYKSMYRGNKLIVVNPAYVNQECPKCGFTHKDNRRGKLFKCQECGYWEDANIKAAKEILKRGLDTIKS